MLLSYKTKMNQKEAEDGQFKIQICARHNSTKNMKKQKQPGAPGRFFDGHIFDGHIIDGHFFDQ